MGTKEKIPTARLRLLDATQAIRDDPEAKTALFLSTFLIQCTLPHSDPGDVSFWKRVNGDEVLVIQPGWDIHNNRQLGLPWGRLPRLLLIWIVTEAKRTGCRRLELGNSLTEFLRKLDLDPRRGDKLSNKVRTKEALHRLLACTITHYNRLRGPGVLGEEGTRPTLANKWKLRWDASPEEQAVLWGSFIEIGLDFFAEIMHSVVPFNGAVLRKLRSPLALDLYLLCNWIAYNLPDRGKKEHRISWKMLEQQLGCDYSDRRDLRRKVQKAVGQILGVHTLLKLERPKVTVGTWQYKGIQQGGLIVKPSAPAIPRKRIAATG